MYNRLYIDMGLAFMAGNIRKDNDKSSHTHAHGQKIHNPILFGAQTVKKVLSFNYQSWIWDVPHGFVFPVGLKRDERLIDIIMDDVGYFARTQKSR